MLYYISGPIFGKEDRNEAMFRQAAEKLQQYGAETVVPHDIPVKPHVGECPAGRRSEGARHNEGCHLKADLGLLVQCDAICLLPDWGLSIGARLELSVAVSCGLSVWVYEAAPFPGVRKLA